MFPALRPGFVGGRLSAGPGNRLAGELVGVIVVMLVKGKSPGRLCPEQSLIFGMLGNRDRFARTADVAVEADDPIAGGHDHVQVVADEHHGKAPVGAQPGNEFVKRGFAHVVDTANGFVENEKFGCAQQGASEQDALEFASRQTGKLGAGG